MCEMLSDRCFHRLALVSRAEDGIFYSEIDFNGMFTLMRRDVFVELRSNKTSDSAVRVSTLDHRNVSLTATS